MYAPGQTEYASSNSDASEPEAAIKDASEEKQVVEVRDAEAGDKLPWYRKLWSRDSATGEVVDTVGSEENIDEETADKPVKQQKWYNRYFGDAENELHKDLKDRHIVLLSLGSVLGTGLFFSTGGTVSLAGPGGALVIYAIVAVFVVSVVTCLSEMASYIPSSGAFAHYGTRFIDESFGFALGVNYYLQWAFSIPSEVASANFVITFWADSGGHHIPQWVWCFVIIFPIFFVQLVNVKVYGEFEFWFAMIKVFFVAMFIIIGLIYNWGGVPTASVKSPGLSNFRHGAAFAGGFSGIFSQGYAFYTYGGTEAVALTSGEVKRPWRTIPKASRGTVIRVLLLIILTVLVIALNVNYKDPRLVRAMDTNDVAVSPITIIFEMEGFGEAKHVINAVLLIAILSSINACYYIASRMLVALAKDKMLPRQFAWTTKTGVPLIAELFTLGVSGLTFLTTIWGNGVVFNWFENITSASSVVTWMSIGIISIRFRMALKAQGVPKSDMPMSQWFYPLQPILCIGIGAFLLAGMGYASCQGVYGVDWNWRSPFGTFLGVGVFIVSYIFWKVWHWKSDRFRTSSEIDLSTGRVWGIGEGKQIMDDFEKSRFDKVYYQKDARAKEKINWYRYITFNPLQARRQLKALSNAQGKI